MEKKSHDTGARTAPCVTMDEVAHLIDQKRGVLLAVIMRYENNRDEAEDILQSATIKALKAAPQNFRGESSLLTYITTLCMNEARHHIRRQRRRKDRLGVYFDHECGEGSHTAEDDERTASQKVEGVETVGPETIAMQREALKRVEAALEEMKRASPRIYRTFEAYLLEGKSYKEIQDTLGVRPSLAKLHVHRMTRKIGQLTGIPVVNYATR